MPIYEYCCGACSKTHEVLQKINTAAPAQCPTCGQQDTLTKSISMGAFHLKGGGWYKDAYASPKPKQPSPATDKGKQKKKEKQGQKPS